MPTLNDYRRWPTTTYLRDSKGVYQYASSSFTDVIVRSRTTPTTVKRKRPVDLFAGGTGRTTSSSYASSTTGTHSTDSGKQLRVGVPLLTVYPAPSSSEYPALPTLEWVTLENRARAAIRDDATNLAMALAEYRQTAKLFLSAARAVSSKGKSLAAAVTARKGVSKTWLGFQYGVKPLVSDILGSIEDLKKAAAQPIYINGTETRVERAFEQRVEDHVAVHWRWRSYQDFSQNRYQRLRWRARFNPNPVFNCLVKHGFGNPFSLAYELIPYSFVLDWWINVGEVLASLDNLLLIDELKTIRSVRTTRGWFVSSGGVEMPSDSHLDSHGGSRVSRTDVRSAPINISPIAVLRYKPSVSLTHILNGLALLNVARGRFPQTRGR
jgi:hypothetical protein